MNSRPLLATLLIILTLTGCVLLYARDPLAGGAAFVSALAGALAGWFFKARGAEDDFDVGRREVVLGDRTLPGGSAAGDVQAGELLATTLESIREGVLVVDGSMRVALANGAARAIFTNDEAFKLGRAPRLSELTRNPAIHSAFAAAVERGQRAGVKFETRLGARRAFDLHVAPLRRRGGVGRHQAVGGAVGVFFDVTSIERLERVRQEFFSNVSHELRTPLTAVLASVETLEDGGMGDPANARRFLSAIRRNAERMNALINDVLELSSIEAGTIRVEPVSLRPAQLVNECLSMLGPRAAGRRVEVRNEVPEDALVFADPRRFEQMLTNLLDNAIKFSPEGGVVSVTYERAGARDLISVSDRGEGIAPEHLPRIFERFYRADPSRSREVGGTGLGLAIVKHLARAHGGEATVRSAPGQGSTFTLELPASADEAAAQ